MSELENLKQDMLNAAVTEEAVERYKLQTSNEVRGYHFGLMWASEANAEELHQMSGVYFKDMDNLERLMWPPCASDRTIDQIEVEISRHYGEKGTWHSGDDRLTCGASVWVASWLQAVRRFLEEVKRRAGAS